MPMKSFKKNTRMTRTQFPVVAGFALTVNKAQGLTIKEGVVINLKGVWRMMSVVFFRRGVGVRGLARMRHVTTIVLLMPIVLLIASERRTN